MSVNLVIKTMMVTKAAISSCTFNSINSTEYLEDNVRKFKGTVVAAAKSVPLLLGGGVHGHVYLLENDPWYQVQTGSAFTEAQRPSKITFSSGANNSVLVQEKVNHATEEETYHTQEGCCLALREAIVKNVPLELITELKDPVSEFNDVKPRDLLALIALNADQPPSSTPRS